jgi:hypothetical protein
VGDDVIVRIAPDMIIPSAAVCALSVSMMCLR